MQQGLAAAANPSQRAWLQQPSHLSGLWLFLAAVREKGLSYRKGIGRVRGNLKRVHWLIMCLCTLQMRLVSERPCAGSDKDVFSWLRCFFAEVQFAQTAFNLHEPPHCLARGAELPDHPIFIACPVSRGTHNLASTVQPDTVTRIQGCLRVIGALKLRARLPSATAVSPPAAVVAKQPGPPPPKQAMAAAAMAKQPSGPEPREAKAAAAMAKQEGLPLIVSTPLWPIPPGPVAAAAPGGEFNCPEWLTIERQILDHELSAHGVRVFECKFDGHTVLVSLPDSSSFGVLPVVV